MKLGCLYLNFPTFVFLFIFIIMDPGTNSDLDTSKKYQKEQEEYFDEKETIPQKRETSENEAFLESSPSKAARYATDPITPIEIKPEPGVFIISDAENRRIPGDGTAYEFLPPFDEEHNTIKTEIQVKDEVLLESSSFKAARYANDPRTPLEIKPEPVLYMPSGTPKNEVRHAGCDTAQEGDTSKALHPIKEETMAVDETYDGVVACPNIKCDFQCGRFNELCEHYKHKHFKPNGVNEYQCLECNGILENNNVLLGEHMNNHWPESSKRVMAKKCTNQYTCYKCSEQFPSRALANAHIFQCDKTYTEEGNKDDSSDDCYIVDSTETEVPQAGGGPSDMYKCPDPQCDGKPHGSFDELCNHMKTTHFETTEDGYLKCKMCKATIPDYNLRLHAHMDRHATSMTNAEGNQELASRNNMETHNSRRFPICMVCKREFPSKRSVQYHMSEHPSAKSAIFCKSCKFMFPEQRLYDLHVGHVHTKEKEFRCETCPTSFDGLYDLKIHRRSHPAGGSYNCYICLEEIIGKASADEHIASCRKIYMDN